MGAYPWKPCVSMEIYLVFAYRIVLVKHINYKRTIMSLKKMQMPHLFLAAES